MDEETGSSLLKRYASIVESFLTGEVSAMVRRSAGDELASPVLYSLLAGGKRIRPVLLLICSGTEIPASWTNGDPLPSDPGTRSALFAAAALESIHTYSLIHDDLPGMDNDDMRRGRPSCHAAYSEWEAILAGDALNTFAFELLAEAPLSDATESTETTETTQEIPGSRNSAFTKLRELTLVLARAAGMEGMVGGQTLDLLAEKTPEKLVHLDSGKRRDFLNRIHLRKTAAMMRASAEMGAILSGSTNRQEFRRYGEELGLLFQITDDILDVTSDSQTLGKTAGKDEATGKLTYPSLFGLEESRRRAEHLAEGLSDLSRSLTPGPGARLDHRDFLEWLPRYIAGRLY